MLAVAYSIQTNAFPLIAGDSVEDNFSGLVAVHSFCSLRRCREATMGHEKHIYTHSAFSKGQRGLA